jgi:hypothetical protein
LPLEGHGIASTVIKLQRRTSLKIPKNKQLIAISKCFNNELYKFKYC